MIKKMYVEAEGKLELHPIARIAANVVPTAIIGAFALGTVWAMLNNDIASAQDTASENKTTIQSVKDEVGAAVKGINAVATEQQVLKQRLEDKMKADELYQQRIEQTLNRILNRLDGVPGQP